MNSATRCPTYTEKSSGSLVNLMQELEYVCLLDIEEPHEKPNFKHKTSATVATVSSPAKTNATDCHHQSDKSFLIAKESCVKKIRLLYETCPLTVCNIKSLDWHIGTILQCDTWADLTPYITTLMIQSETIYSADAVNMFQALSDIKANTSTVVQSAKVQSVRKTSDPSHDVFYEPLPSPASDPLTIAAALLAKSVNLNMEDVSIIASPKLSLSTDDKVWSDMFRKETTCSPPSGLVNPSSTSSKEEQHNTPISPNTDIIEDSNSNITMKGVSFDRSKRNWEASWLDARTGRRVKKCFSEGRWGNSARQMAVMARKKAEKSGVISTRCQTAADIQKSTTNTTNIQKKVSGPPPLQLFKPQFASSTPPTVASSQPVTPDSEENQSPKSRLIKLLEDIGINADEILRKKSQIHEAKRLKTSTKSESNLDFDIFSNPLPATQRQSKLSPAAALEFVRIFLHQHAQTPPAPKEAVSMDKTPPRVLGKSESVLASNLAVKKNNRMFTDVLIPIER